MTTIEDRMGRAFGLEGTLWFLDRMVWLYDDMAALGHTPAPVNAAKGDPS